MKVIIADDHRTVREGLRWMLSEHPTIEVVGEAADGEELLRLVDDIDADVILLDVNMPGMGGLDALEAMRAKANKPRVIVLSMHDKPVYVRRAIELGAAGYLLKSAGRDELLRALQTVASGGVYLQGEVTGPLLDQVAAGGPTADRRLTVRQTEILALVADGQENKQIARALHISEATVKSYLQAAFERLGVHSRAEAVAVALRDGLIE